MTTLRSSLPSRLRQLLSSEGAIGPSIKLDSEPVRATHFCLFTHCLLFIFIFGCCSVLFRVLVLSNRLFRKGIFFPGRVLC